MIFEQVVTKVGFTATSEMFRFLFLWHVSKGRNRRAATGPWLLPKKEWRWKKPKPKTETLTPTPERKMGKREDDGEEKKKEETPAPLFPFAKRDVLSA